VSGSSVITGDIADVLSAIGNAEDSIKGAGDKSITDIKKDTGLIPALL
jgi:hypothetical protein